MSQGSEETPDGEGPEHARTRRPVPRALRPRPETLLLLISLAWTLGAKLLVIRGQSPDDLAAAVVGAWLPDLVFFAGIAALLALLFVPRPAPLAGSVALLLAAAVLVWSMLNAGWLFATSVQLQPEVLGVVLEEPAQFVPIVQEHVRRRPGFAVPIMATIALGGVWIVWRLVRPLSVRPSRRHHLLRAGIAALILVVAAVGHRIDTRGGQVAYSGAVLGFSSHWYAITRVASDVAHRGDVAGATRVLPRAGQRTVLWPAGAAAPPPNVVVIFLESVSHHAVRRAEMAVLSRLASEGVEFVYTRVPVAQTNKAFWSALTGSIPDLSPDAVESVPVDGPYESLASLLAPRGYRSAFFEMSKGTFECAPGLFSNLGFDWAWFRENLEDESAHLGYMNGDDFRMVEPMFEWVDEGDGPFLLSMITSVAHDPYELPSWYEREPAADRYGRYLQSVTFTDEFVGRVCKELAERGLLDRTLLCVIGDHGDAFRPESRLGRWAPFEEVIRVPWIIRWPGHVEAGGRIETACSQLDITPTILRLLGADVTAAGFDGADALGSLDPGRRLFFSTWYRNSPFGYLEGSRKLVYWPSTDTLFAYDLDADPDEQAPHTVTGVEKGRVVAELRRWKRESAIDVQAKRFRESMRYEHWRTFSSGRSAWAYYVP